jgi:geranylgeranyl pyrophosphate synthase
MKRLQVSEKLTVQQPFFTLVLPDLERVERKMRQKPQSRVRYPALEAVVDHVIDSGGKRVRPALSLLVGQMYDADMERVIALAAAVELLHTATLVHDDLIDGAALRRGYPTLNTKWTPGATVLTGDYLFARAADLAAQTDSVPLLHLFAHTLMVICSGELKQMFEDRVSLDRQQYHERIYAKTAALFALSVEAAGILGGAPQAQIDALREYGEQLGQAFQIVDDVLDFVGDQAKLGKPVGGDLKQGLVTLPTLVFLEQYPEHKLVCEVLKNGRQDDASIAKAVTVIRQSGAIEAALDEARQFVRRSQDALQVLPPGESRQALWGLADFVLNRDL